MPLKIDHTGFYIKTYLIKTSVKIQGQNLVHWHQLPARLAKITVLVLLQKILGTQPLAWHITY